MERGAARFRQQNCGPYSVTRKPPAQFAARVHHARRSYSSGYETDLEYWLLRRPRETVLNGGLAVGGLVKRAQRSGAFERVEPRERGSILREHASIGKAYGAQDLAHDVRLALSWARCA